jgi:hypothetical protein
MIRTTRIRPDARPKSPLRSVAALLLPITALVACCLFSPSTLLGQATPTPNPSANTNTNTNTKTPLLLAHYMPWYLPRLATCLAKDLKGDVANCPL